MDKLNESPMLMTNYLMSTLRSDGNAANPAEVEKCYNGLLEEYSKVCVCGGVWWWWWWWWWWWGWSG